MNLIVLISMSQATYLNPQDGWSVQHLLAHGVSKLAVNSSLQEQTYWLATLQASLYNGATRYHRASTKPYNKPTIKQTMGRLMASKQAHSKQ